MPYPDLWRRLYAIRLAVIEGGLKLHDYAALAPVVKGAGGLMTDWQGRELTLESDGNVIAAGDAKVHVAVLEVLGQ